MPFFALPDPEIVATRLIRVLRAGQPADLLVRFSCAYDGSAPRVDFSGGSLGRDEWIALRDEIDQGWRELTIPCRCHHAFALHAVASPHACAECACVTFTSTLARGKDHP